ERHLPRLRQRHPGGPQPDAAPGPRRDRPDRIGAGLPGDPGPVGVLRRQARHPGLHRVGPLRAPAPEVGRPHRHGAAAGGEHDAVRLGAVAPAPQAPARPADLPAGAHRQGRGPHGRASPAGDVADGADGAGHPRQPRRPRLPRPAPGSQRRRIAADRRARRPRPAGQPVAAGGRGPRRPRTLRRPGPGLEPAGVVDDPPAHRGGRLPRPAGPERREVPVTTLPPLDGLSAAAYTVPTDGPESDGTIAWDATTAVVVTASAGGETGLGYAYGSGAAAAVAEGVLFPAVLAGGTRSAADVPAAFAAMGREVRNIGRAGVASTAISATDTALWDLKARLLHL